MALLANDPAQRVEQLLLLTSRLTALIAAETRRIDAREPLAEGAEAEEKARLANAYRLELARIKQDQGLIEGAPRGLLNQLKQNTVTLQDALAAHDIALSAARIVSEGLVQAMAEEVVRQRGAAAGYGAKGAVRTPAGSTPALFDRNA